MQRVYQLVFVASLLAVSWLAMMGVHEMGHVAGALLTGGRVQRVVLHPTRISRTDVSPNPRPVIVAWAGPVVGCLLPWWTAWLLPRRLPTARNLAMFFAGFCLVANGVYLLFGSLYLIGDARVLLQHGTPMAAPATLGIATLLPGLWIWHCLGSLSAFMSTPSRVTAQMASITFAVLALVVACVVLFCSP